MRIGILGSGNMGGALGALFAARGHEVVFSFARTTQKLERLAKESGPRARAGTPREAAQGADVVVLTVHWSHVDRVLAEANLAPGCVVLDATNPMREDEEDMTLVVGRTTSGAETIAAAHPALRIVKAFNTVPSELLRAISERGVEALPVPPSAFYCGEDDDAKSIVAALIRETGFEAVDVGRLPVARYLEPAALLISQVAYADGASPEVGFALVRM